VESKDTKDIQVTFADALPLETAGASVASFFPEVSIAGLPISGKISIKNTGVTSIAPQVFFVESKMLTPNQQIVTATSIPPFGHQDWNVKFHPVQFLTNTSEAFTIRFAQDSDLGGKTTEVVIKIAPFFLTLWGIGGITLGILAIILLTIILKVRRVRLP